MSAKSAPQLFVNRIRTASLHLHAALLIVAIAVLTAGARWAAEEAHKLTVASTESESSEASSAEPLAQPDAPAVVAAPVQDNSRYRALSEFLAKRYRVSQAFTLDLVTIAHTAGKQVGLDPLLIIAVMAVESRFNPIAESTFGAKGLMQVIPRFHSDKFREAGGEKYAVFDPQTNILVGAQILKEYIGRTGSLSSALQLYVGSSNDEDDSYLSKVITEKERLQQVVQKKKAVPLKARVEEQKEVETEGEKVALAPQEP